MEKQIITMKDNKVFLDQVLEVLNKASEHQYSLMVGLRYAVPQALTKEQLTTELLTLKKAIENISDSFLGSLELKISQYDFAGTELLDLLKAKLQESQNEKEQPKQIIY